MTQYHIHSIRNIIDIVKNIEKGFNAIVEEKKENLR